jgi:LysW-gamma-L-lysine carboxypeptidase
MNEEYTTVFLRRMLEIPSFSGQEGELAAYLVAEMRQLGFRSYTDGAGNAIGELGDCQRPQILLLGHMDTVCGDIPVRQEDSKLYGRGAVDAKGSLATLMCAAAMASPLPARVIVAGTVEEETPGSRGAHHLCEYFNPDVVIVGEPSGWSNVTIGYRGRIGIIYEIHRPPSHPASPTPKASEEAVIFWNRIVKHLEDMGGDRTAFHSPAATLCRMAGTPSDARLEITCRIPPEFDLPAFEAFLTGIRGDGDLSFDERTPAILTDRNTPPVHALVSSIRRHGGRPGMKVKTGTSDMNIVAERWRVPMVAYGPGDSRLDHTSNEHLDLAELDLAVAVLADALRSLADELQPGPAEHGYTDYEEQTVASRLRDLGYLD